MRRRLLERGTLITGRRFLPIQGETRGKPVPPVLRLEDQALHCCNSFAAGLSCEPPGPFRGEVIIVVRGSVSPSQSSTHSMRTALLALLPAALLAACGSSTSPGTDGTSCPLGCPTGYVCVSGGCQRAAGTDGGTDAGTAVLTCDMSLKPVGTSALPAGQVLHLGTFTAGDQPTFDVPAGTASVTIVEQAVSAPDSITVRIPGQSAVSLINTAVPLTVTDPAGELMSDAPLPAGQTPPDPETLRSFFASQSPATGTLTFPNTSRGLGEGVLPGTWSVKVSDYAYECASGNLVAGAICPVIAPSRYEVTVLTKPQANGGIPATGTLELDFYFVADPSSGSPLTAATAATDPDLARMSQSLKSIFAQAGISVGSVRYHDLPADVRARYGSVDVDQSGACAPLPQLLKYAAPGNGMNIFLTDLVAKADPNTPNSTVVGVDGTIPGPASIGGTVASGAAVSVQDLRFSRGSSCIGNVNFHGCGADQVAFIAAHEAAHFLGLYHVTESDGTSFDPLADTARCSCQACTNAARSQCADSKPAPAASHPMSTAECTASTLCGGGNNLMFWLAGGTGELSSEQQRVMRSNPLVQ